MGTGSQVDMIAGIGMQVGPEGHTPHDRNLLPESSSQAGPQVAESENLRTCDDNTRLFTGTLAKGDTETISKTGPVRIGYSEGDYLVVENNVQRFKMPQSSVGSSTLE